MVRKQLSWKLIKGEKIKRERDRETAFLMARRKRDSGKWGIGSEPIKMSWWDPPPWLKGAESENPSVHSIGQSVIYSYNKQVLGSTLCQAPLRVQIAKHRPCPQGAYNPTVQYIWDPWRVSLWTGVSQVFAVPWVGEEGSPLLSSLLGGLFRGAKEWGSRERARGRDRVHPEPRAPWRSREGGKHPGMPHSLREVFFLIFPLCKTAI